MNRLKSPAYLSWLLFLACCAVLPFISSEVMFSITKPSLTNNFTVTPKLPFIVCMTGLSLFFWGLEQVKQRRLLLRHPLLSLLIALFLVWVVVSTIFSINPVASLYGTTIDSQGTLIYLCCGVIVFLGLQHIASTKQLMTLARMLVLSGAAVAVIALAQSLYAQWGPSNLGGNAWMVMQGGAALGNPDFTGGFLAPLCVLAVGLALFEPQSKVRLAYGAAICLMGAAIVVSQSRAAYLAVACAVLFLLVIVLSMRRQNPARVKLKGGIAALALVCSLLLGLAVAGAQLPGLQNKVLPRAPQTVNTYSGTRLTFWLTALKVCAAHPLTGTGPDVYQKGAYRYVSVAADPQTGQRIYHDDPHSYPLLITASMGVPALLALLALGAISFRTLWATLRKKSIGEKQFASLVIWAAFLAVGIVCCFENANIAVSALAAVLGAATLVTADQKVWHKKGLLAPALIVPLVAVLLGAGFYCSLRPLRADRYMELYLDTKSQPMLEKAVAQMPWDYRLQEQLVVLRSNQLFTTVDVNSYQTQFVSLDAYLADLNEKYPYELVYMLERDDVALDAIANQGQTGAGFLSAFKTLLDGQIAQYPQLVDLQLFKAELLFYQGETSSAFSLLDKQPPSVLRDCLRLSFYLSEGQTTQAQSALTGVKTDWPPSDLRDSYVSSAEQYLSGGSASGGAAGNTMNAMPMPTTK